MVKEFEDLLVWQEAHKLTLMVYGITSHFPAEEKYGLVSDMRRATVSIENNIAEGFGRRTTKDYINFLFKSYASLLELRSMTRVSFDIKYINIYENKDLMDTNLSVKRLFRRLISSLESKSKPIV